MCKRGRTVQTVQTFPRGSDELNFGYHVRAWLLTCTTNRLSRETLSLQRVPEPSDFSRSHARIGITTILHNAPQLHYSLHPTHTIRSSPPRSPKSLFRGSRNLVLSPITTQHLPVTSGKDRLVILSQPLLKDSDRLLIGPESFREYGGDMKPTGFGLT